MSNKIFVLSYQLPWKSDKIYVEEFYPEWFNGKELKDITLDEMKLVVSK